MSITCPSLITAIDPGLCRAVDHYCERVGPGLDAEPINALTNIAFLVAAAGASYLYDHVPDAEPKGQLRGLIYLMALVGLGSLLFHTVATRWAEWGDVIPITLFLTLYLWIAFSHFFVMPVPWRVALITLIVGATFFAEARISPEFLQGGALYVPIVAALTTIGAVLLRQQPVAGGGVIAATAVFLVSLTVRTLDAAACDQPEPGLCNKETYTTGMHFLWHVCNAIVLYILTTVAIVHVRIARSAQER